MSNRNGKDVEYRFSELEDTMLNIDFDDSVDDEFLEEALNDDTLNVKLDIDLEEDADDENQENSEEKKKAKKRSKAKQLKKQIQELLAVIALSARDNMKVLVPVQGEGNEPYEILDYEVEKEKETEGHPFRFVESEGEELLPVFTEEEDLKAGKEAMALRLGLGNLLNFVMESNLCDGIILNPWTHQFVLTIPDIEALFGVFIPEQKPNEVEITWEGEATEGAERVLFRQKKWEHDSVDELCRYYWSVLEVARQNDIHKLFVESGLSWHGDKGALLDKMGAFLQLLADWMEIYEGYGLSVTICEKDENHARWMQEAWEKCQKEDPHKPENMEEALESAMELAMKTQRGFTMRSTGRPVLLHSLDILQILNAMECDTEQLVAGLLMNVSEDDILWTIYVNFGRRVAHWCRIMCGNPEEPWYQSRVKKLSLLEEADIPTLQLALAEGLAELRLLSSEYKKHGDKLWDTLRPSVPCQAWYYSELDDVIEPLRQNLLSREFYWEMTDRFKDLFVIYFHDEVQNQLVQLSADRSAYMLERGSFSWVLWTGEISDQHVTIPRKKAERIEANWMEEFDEKIEEDLAEAVYHPYSEDGHIITIRTGEEGLTLEEEGNPEGHNRKIELDHINAEVLMASLRQEFGLHIPLETILYLKFGEKSGAGGMHDCCTSIRLEFTETEL